MDDTTTPDPVRASPVDANTFFISRIMTLRKRSGNEMKPVVGILIIVLCLCTLALPVAAVQGDTGNAPGGGSGPALSMKNLSGEPVRETIENDARPENLTGLRIQDRTGIGNGTAVTPPGQNVSYIREMIRINREEMNAALQAGSSSDLQQNRNRVRLAVRTLLAVENITGGIGPGVSAIARDFNNSAQHEWQLEQRITDRGSFTRFFFGGDRYAARELASLTIQNQDRIRQIEQLVNSGAPDNETRAMLEEQVQIMEQENARLNQTAAAELKNRGILGWFGV